MALQRLSTAYAQPIPKVIHTYKYLVCHFGELMLKRRNRGRFEGKLISNMRAKLDDMGVKSIRKQPGRAIVEFDQWYPLKDLHDKASKMFGVANALPAHCVGATIEELEAIIPAALDGVEFNTFAVRCRRAEKRFPLNSQEICIRIGQQIGELTGATVDLTNPELTCWVEVLSHHIIVAIHRIEAPGGLPVGITGRVASLLSAGIDSPVATWRMMQRGCEPFLFHFHSAPFTSAASQEKVRELTRCLAQWHGPLKLAMIPFGPIQQEIVATCPEPYRVILYRRLMMRIAAALAQTVDASALVTGDSLAQVASQTLSNLATIEASSVLPILRPLVGMDKLEIIHDARRIGTYDLSIEPHDDCCSFLEPRKPATNSSPAALDRAETRLDISTLVQQGVNGVEWHCER